LYFEATKMAASVSSINGNRSTLDETTPLLVESQAGLAGSADAEPAPHPPSNDDEKPLPVGQIILLCYARLVEPIAFFSIFPFVNQMIWETGNVDEADVGFYSGLIVRSLASSVLPVTNAVSIAGITVFFYANAPYDFMGPCCGPLWEKTCAGILTRRVIGRRRPVWP
jgi:hypothetical protein